MEYYHSTVVASTGEPLVPTFHDFHEQDLGSPESELDKFLGCRRALIGMLWVGRGNPIQNLYIPTVASKAKSRLRALKHAKMCDKFAQLRGS